MSIQFVSADLLFTAVSSLMYTLKNEHFWAIEYVFDSVEL